MATVYISGFDLAELKRDAELLSELYGDAAVETKLELRQKEVQALERVLGFIGNVIDNTQI